MTKQIAVRLPDHLIEFIDGSVASGESPSRSALITRALERDRRRSMAERDAAILARSGPDPELSGLAGHVVRRPLDLD